MPGRSGWLPGRGGSALRRLCWARLGAAGPGLRAYPPGETEQVERQPAGCGTVSPALTGAGARPPAAAIHAAVVTSWQGTSRDGDPQDQWAWACPGMGAQMGARSARTCSRPLSSAPPGTVLTWARTHSCRPPPSGNIPGGQGVAGSNPAVPTGRNLSSNTKTRPWPTDGSAMRSHQFDETTVARPVAGDNATGQQGPAEPTYGVAHPGALVSGSKGHRFTFGRQGWLWATPAEDPGGIRHNKRWRLFKRTGAYPPSCAASCA